ncbi:hypothetical protein [Pontibacter fetidus]|uniref:YcxB family protein n=1 Tax=Pontibacter fetidus TaxID=2700082 RepID=A0A6B2H3F0_9BACT|nr:hypothetical protein [Pontibacter fetidus]NDK55146.1 hypothetical protein [Pontibacter fetidus]
MQEINIRLFSGAYAGNPKAEQRTTMLAVFLVLLQVGLLLYLVLTKGFAYSFVGIYLLHLLAFSVLVAQVWLELHPEYSRHLSFNSQTIVYRTGFLVKEQEFDWDEVDEVTLSPENVRFMLKNDEYHVVPFTMVQSPEALRRARHEIRQIVQQKKIHLTESQK